MAHHGHVVNKHNFEEYKMDYEYLDYLVEKYRERNEMYYTESSSNMIWAVAGGAIIALSAKMKIEGKLALRKYEKENPDCVPFKDLERSSYTISSDHKSVSNEEDRGIFKFCSKIVQNTNKLFKFKNNGKNIFRVIHVFKSKGPLSENTIKTTFIGDDPMYKKHAMYYRNAFFLWKGGHIDGVTGVWIDKVLGKKSYDKNKKEYDEYEKEWVKNRKNKRELDSVTSGSILTMKGTELEEQLREQRKTKNK